MFAIERSRDGNIISTSCIFPNNKRLQKSVRLCSFYFLLIFKSPLDELQQIVADNDYLLPPTKIKS
jgi:hypothetical protein